MIYLDNAATGGFKPSSVTTASYTVLKYLCANPGRSGHRLSVAGARIAYETRKLAADIFGASPDRVIFTKNCTEALNIAILGCVKKGDRVITTVFEHNSVLRPLLRLKKLGVIELDVVSPDKGKDVADAIENAVRLNTRLIVANCLSNVTGEVLPFEKIGEIAKARGIKFIADGAQAGGHIPLSLKSGINALALAGHKGLLAPMGCGLLVFDDNTDITPVFTGGTGTETFEEEPTCYPEKLECGTLNLPAIAGLSEGLKYVRENLRRISEILSRHSGLLIRKLSDVPRVKLYSSPNPAGIVSFKMEGADNQKVAGALNDDFDIAVRAGFHCAPLLHKYLGTTDDGLIRISLSVQNSLSEIYGAVKAIKNIAARSDFFEFGNDLK